ncbi:DDE-type integrase/transposase/recombinase [Nostoc sp. C052]|uniref:TnsA endonuclease N-terminal domain-containing protein n=1 Tax=Nostoc sp. C052 TaxID=2576902 RepID=UPI0015C3F1B0|nr:DDE-type integrase/transposase/recombinase [Nostoc sp. C052]QLE40443.1 DDE-type integrase/transposase/recombinase [Nostoc sp. C052]
MLYDVEFQAWCNNLQLSQQQRDLVNQIRTSPPARKVQGGGRNVHGPYASSKMGRTIQFESHTVELPAITQFYEYDDQVLEYWDQPIKFSIKCSPQGKQATTIGHYPDFFVMRKDCCGFEEWKTEKRLEKLSEEQPYRYQKIERQWVDVIVQEYIENLGYYYRLRSDNEIDWVKYRNQKYLQPYKQGYLKQQYILNDQVEANVQEIIVNYPGINLITVLEKAKNATIDDINTLIALEKVYVNLSEVALVEQEKVHLFRDQATAEAYITATHDYCEPVSSNVSIVDLKAGSSFLLDGKSLTIDHIGESKIIFRGEQGIVRWTYAEFEQLIELGEISSLQTENHTTLGEEGWQYFLEASPKALETANSRYAAIKPYLEGEPYNSKKCDLSERTLRDWRAKYRKAQQKYGCGFIGLIPQYKGNPTPRYSDEDLEFIDQVIKEQYETFKLKNVWQTYEVLRDKWQESGRISPIPSHTLYYERVKKRNSYQQTKKRMGFRAANNLLGPWLIQPTTPRHGDRPFEIVHIDHTKLDVECICPYSGKNLGRPWVTGMIDAYSRRILALYLTFDNPSYRSCMMAIRICVQRFGRFPECIVVDNGKEFSSTYFETLLARFEASKKHRPKDYPKFSSIIERWFGSQNTEFINNLRGNTQIMKHVRFVKKANNPKNLAVWNLEELYNYLAFGYAYGVYDKAEHPALEGMSPHKAFELGLATTGHRPHQYIKYDEQFKILTLPTNNKGMAKVIPGQGIRVNYQNYWADEFYSVENQSIPVRYDPLDYGVTYAYVNNHWVKCLSNYYMKFQGHSEKAVAIATTICRRKRQIYNQSQYVGSKEIVDLLNNAEENEELILQIRRDQSAKLVFNLIEGNLSSAVLLNISNTEQHLSQDSQTIEEENLDLIDLKEDNLQPNLPKKFNPDDIRAFAEEELW